RQFLEPAAGRGVVVGTGVHHGVENVVVRQMRVIRTAIEGELEDACPGYVELVSERAHISCDQPEILCDECPSAQVFLSRAEEVNARPGYPLPKLSSWGAGAYVPRGREAAKVIQPNHVHVREQGTEAVYAPTVAGLAKSFPVVDGVAPKLPLRAEVVGRHAGDETRPMFIIQEEQFRIAPDVA